MSIVTSKTLEFVAEYSEQAIQTFAGPNVINIQIDGEGFTIANGVKTPYIVVPFDCTITGWRLRASASDTMTVDVLYNATLGSAPASITGAGTKPNIAGAISATGTSMTGWTTSLSKGGVLAVQVSGTPTVATWAVLGIDVTRV